MDTVQQVLQQLVESRLLTREVAETSCSRWRAASGETDDAAGDKFLAWPVKEGILSDFQAEAFQAGHGGPLLLGPYRVLARMAVGTPGQHLSRHP